MVKLQYPALDDLEGSVNWNLNMVIKRMKYLYLTFAVFFILHTPCYVSSDEKEQKVQQGKWGRISNKLNGSVYL
jgi:hypothetical protein